MKTVKDLRNHVNNNTLTDFILQDYVKYFAENIESMGLGAEMAFKEYIRKGAEQQGININDLQAVYNSYRNKIKLDKY